MLKLCRPAVKLSRLDTILKPEQFAWEDARVSQYLFYYLDSDGAVPSFDSTEAAGPEEAVRFGLHLLERWPERAAVEVWDDQRRITTVVNPARR